MVHTLLLPPSVHGRRPDRRSARSALRRSGLAVGVALVIAAQQAAAAPGPDGPPAFTAVQPELFAVAGALANAWADFDGDGDLDLAVSMKSGAILLYENDDGVFRSVGGELGLPTEGEEIRGLSWGDYDGDGDLDLYAADRAGANRLLTNRGAGAEPRFTYFPYSNGTVDVRRTVGACWFDSDGDGDLDLFLANQSGDSDALWRNDGERFVDVAPALGMDQTQRWLNEGGVGCAPGDYDNDGDLDLYVGTYGRNLLYRNDTVDGRPRFVEVALASGVAEPHSVVGAAWGDVDNDGDLDLFVASYERVDGVQEPRNRLFINSGQSEGGRFRNVLATDDLLNSADHGVVWVDYDRDGDVDLSVTDGYGPVGGHPV
ncbi:MAG: VCBS repeat-containing protein, partial [Thioalkalivibrio sp.]|nr:VCBS repeat-containing protein [Thioalkalivibrio sp.]